MLEILQRRISQHLTFDHHFNQFIKDNVPSSVKHLKFLGESILFK